jgi:hypothetical protein
MIASKILLFRVERVPREVAGMVLCHNDDQNSFCQARQRLFRQLDGLPFAEFPQKRSRRHRWSRKHPRGSRDIHLALSDFDVRQRINSGKIESRIQGMLAPGKAAGTRRQHYLPEDAEIWACDPQFRFPPMCSTWRQIHMRF